VIAHSKDCDRVLVLYNEFKNVISQFQRKVELMKREEFTQSFKFVTKHDPDSMSQHPDLFYDFYISTTFYNAMLNNIASEQSSRMNAMENASKNAGEIVNKLTLEYNKARQAKITMELCEIISGASAV
jgi:F-type H+-transporting ATPase subunit gamma